ncbi:uncharacterized protein DIP-epsilon isoform X4 [Eurosta solidaginis]|uniref:uncharacterized protein DIP-epsilon isoform X4 n=1 Tax=Eurosta solidaginis TaxID=178769 RepID=UPI0035311A0B
MFLINYLVAVAVLHQLCCHIPLCKSSPTNRSVENFAISVNEQQVQTIESCMDLNEDPCDNYYAYACGKWAHQHTGEHYTETLGLIDYRVNKRLIDYFQDYQPRSDFGVKSNKTWTDKIWLYYRACRQSKEMQLKRYLELVRPNANLDWPLLLEVREPNATWSANQFNWLFTLAKLRRYGFHGAFIDHIVTENSENDSVYVISLDKHEAESDNKLPDMATITVLLMHIGVERKRAFLVAKKLWEFESELQKLYEIDDETETLPGNPSYKATMRLYITNVQKSDYGSYKCVAKNPRGEMDGTIKLYMSSPPTTMPPPTTTRRTTIAPAWDIFSTPIYGIMPTNSMIVIDKLGNKYQSNLNEIDKSEQKLTVDNSKGYDWSNDKSAATTRTQLLLQHSYGSYNNNNIIHNILRMCCNYAMLIAFVGMLLTTWLQQTAINKVIAIKTKTTNTIHTTTTTTVVPVLSAKSYKTIRKELTIENSLMHTQTHNRNCAHSKFIAYKQA